MWRALVFIGLIGLAAFGAVWLADLPETVAFTWKGREYTTSLALGVVAVAVAAMVLSLLWGILRFLMGLPRTVAARSRNRRRDRGYSALSRGIIAVGAGDLSAARRHAGEAERLISQEPLTLLLSAQAAQASGNRPGAEAAFRRMAERPETRVLGLRGLYLEARRQGENERATSYAQEAARLAPSVAWANEAVLEFHSGAGDWKSALAMLDRRASLGLVDKATARRQRAVLHAADALAREQSNPDGALTASLEALRLAPDLVPAAALAGRLLSQRGDLKRAAKVIETAWRTTAHPELAAAYLNLRPGDSATDRLARAETLARLSSWAPEARLAIASAAVEAGEFARARSVLQPLVEEQPTTRVCTAMAELERREGNLGAMREWLARAARAPQDKAWMADGIVSEQWAPVSPVSGRVDAFVWDTPPAVLGRSFEADQPAEAEDNEVRDLPTLPGALEEPKMASTGEPAVPSSVPADEVPPSLQDLGDSQAELKPKTPTRTARPGWSNGDGSARASGDAAAMTTEQPLPSGDLDPPPPKPERHPARQA
jgi:HemY protein